MKNVFLVSIFCLSLSSCFLWIRPIQIEAPDRVDPYRAQTVCRNYCYPFFYSLDYRGRYNGYFCYCSNGRSIIIR